MSQWLTQALAGYRPRERSEAQLRSCLGEAPTADAIGISKRPGRVPLAPVVGFGSFYTFLSAFVLVRS
jgi:hypothetical protein